MDNFIDNLRRMKSLRHYAQTLLAAGRPWRTNLLRPISADEIRYALAAAQVLGFTDDDDDE